MTLTLGERADKALKIVRECPEIAYDTETSGLDWKRNKPVGYVITASHEDNFYIPVRHAQGGNLADPNCPPLVGAEDDTVPHRFEIELGKAFEERRRHNYKTIGHNLKFDMHFSAEQGILLGRNCEDTSLNEALLDEFCKSFSLDACAKVHGVVAKRGEEMYAHLASLFGGVADKKQMSNFWKTSGIDEVVVDYAIGDGITTLELARAQRKLIEEEEMSVIHDIESQLIWTVFKMEHRGIKVDMSRMEEIIDHVKTLIYRAEQTLPTGLNVRSAPQIRKFMEEAGHTDWPTTDIGNPSFTEKWLKGHEEGRAIITLRKYTNLLNSFVYPLRDTHIYKGRVHSSLNQLKADEYGTISGRFSSSQPNMQQIPKRDKELGRLFRSLFVPDDGYKFYESDYSQCEPRLFAHYSKDEALISGYNQTPPRDVHQVVAELLDVERDPTAKRMNMGIFTGMQVDAFAKHMEWDTEHAREMFNKWFDMFVSIKNFQNSAKNIFKNRRYVKTLLGRRCRLDHPRFAYRGTSRIIQGGNADILKYKMLEIDKMLEAESSSTELLMTVHDSLNGQAPDTPEGEAMWKKITEIATNVQCEPFNLRVPFVMDTGSGRNWAIATYGEEKNG